MSNAGKKEYLIGYGKPPKSTQFKSGQSGNPKGRPRGSFSLTTEIEKELSSSITVIEHGRKMKFSKGKIVAKQLVNKAAGGDLKATNLVLSHSMALGLSDKQIPQDQEKKLQHPIHKKTLESIIERIRNVQAQTPLESVSESSAGALPKNSSPRRRVQLITN